MFNKLRAKILAIDPTITEQFNKYYITFRTTDESNFVAIVPQKSRLRITLNIPSEDLRDSRGICSNIEDLGYWGGGQRTLFGFNNLDDLDYVIDLIKESFNFVSNE